MQLPHSPVSGFADMVAGKSSLLDDHGIDAVRPEPQGAGASGGTAADNGYRYFRFLFPPLNRIFD